MKKLFTLVLLAVIVSFAIDLSAQTGQDWKWLNPTPQGNTLRYVKMWDANNWYAIGYAGTFMKTTNAGVTWTFHHKAGGQYLAYTGQSINMYDAHFINQTTGIVVGSSSVNGGIVRTTNGGTTFDTISGLPVSGIFYQVQFLNTTTGYAVGTTTPKIFVTTNAGATWTGLATAPTTTVYDIYAFDANNLILSTTSGNVQKSTDAGATWSAVIATGTTTVGNKLHFVNANTGYIAGATGKFSFTTNGGTNWTSKTVTVGGVTNTSAYYDIAAVPTIVNPPMKLLEDFEGATFPPTGWTLGTATPLIWITAPVSGYGIGAKSAEANFYSIASGFQELISTALSSPTVAGDSLKFDHAYATYSGENDNLDILTSTNGGTNWTLLINLAGGTSGPLNTGGTTSSNFVPTAAQWATKTFVLPVGTNKVSFKGNTAYGNNLYIDNVKIAAGFAPVVSSKVFLTGDAMNIYKTDNNGTSWDTVGFTADVASQPWTSTYYATSLSLTGDTLVTVGAFGLINRRTSASNRIVYTALKKAGISYDVWAQNSTVTGVILAVGARSSALATADQVLRSTNGGASWNLAAFPATAFGYLNSIHMIDNNTGWACGSLASLFKTTNGGASWDSVATPFGIGSFILSRVQFVNATTGWVFSKSSMPDTMNIIKTTNGGTTWTKQRVDSASSLAAYVYWADMVDANTGYAVNYSPDPIKTTNGGVNWIIQTKVDTYAGTLYGVEMINANTGFLSGGSGRIYKTTNGGVLWDTLANKPGGTSPSWYGIKFYNHLVGVSVGSNGMTIETSDGGATWVLHNSGGASVTHYNVCLVPGSVGYTCGSSGFVFKNANLPLVLGVENLTELPMNYELSQNYPNPFNPTTTIKFAMPRTGIVSMKIFDVAGREVMRLINNQTMNAGYQKYAFDGSKLSSGVYFYSLIVDNNLIDTKKMVLIK
jgi:photosystem II stability/assembly factor-like uncharacterized protein